MDTVFQIVALLLAIGAGYSLSTGDGERAFVLAVLGAVAFFLAIRVQTKSRLADYEEERLRQAGEQRALTEDPGSETAERFDAREEKTRETNRR